VLLKGRLRAGLFTYAIGVLLRCWPKKDWKANAGKDFEGSASCCIRLVADIPRAPKQSFAFNVGAARRATRAAQRQSLVVRPCRATG